VHTEYSYSILNIYWIINNAHALLAKILGLFGKNNIRNYFYDFICIPDHFIGWIPHTCIKGNRLIKKNNIDVIYVSCTPHSTAITGIVLKKLSGLPLIIDYRDPYYLNSGPESCIRDKIDRKIQSIFLNHADIVIVNNEGTRKLYVEQYPMVKDKIFAVHNGFDAENMPAQTEKKYEKFTIIYTGEFYFGLIPADLFFRAIAHLREQGSINNQNFQFLFYGDGTYEVKRLCEKYGISDLVAVSKRIPYEDVLTALSRSHLQLLRILKPMISTKLFEGIPVNVPFLATIPSGEAEDIIRKYSPSSYIISGQSYKDVAGAITDAMSKYSSGQIEDNNVQGFLQEFSRENLTLKLMNIIDDYLHQEKLV
jgi:glycosyltransferase involved in cell wall biosynthesis